jgi:DNA-directed DNA polymerase III PolC
MIQLKVRSEFSFKQTFAPLPRVIDRLKALHCSAAGLVDLDGSTWGHVRWEKECEKAGIQPMFGLEIVVVPKIDGATQTPTAWALASNPSDLYRVSTLAHTQKLGGRPALTLDQFAKAQGLVKFCGGALLDHPECIGPDTYVDVAPASVLHTSRALSLARRTGAKLVWTSDNYFSAPEDRPLFGLTGRQEKPTPQHLLALEEARATMNRLSDAEWKSAVANAAEIAEQLKGVKLPKAPIIKLAGDVEAIARAGIPERFGKKGWDKEHEDRLQRELQLVREKEFDSYFLMVADMCHWAKQRMFVGPARGSAAGSLLCYLMGITEIDPLPFGLIFERFVDVTRADLPDIDLDFPDTKRDQVYAYLAEKYGAPQVARIGTISEYKPKSALSEVAKRLDIPPWETKAVRDAMFVRSSGDSRANNCLLDTLNETDAGKTLLSKFPAMRLAADIEGHASHTGVHAGGVIVCNVPISDYCTVDDGVAQLDKVDAEGLNLLKIDVLGLRTLSVIEDAGVEPKGGFYKLALNDSGVFDLLNSHKFAGIFQWEGQALQSVTKQIKMRTFEDMSHITALARPGPMGGGAAGHFINRHNKTEKVDVAHPSMMDYLGDTFGLVIYQEQVMRIVRDIGDFSWKDTSVIRKIMSKSQGKEIFDQLGAKFAEGARKKGLSDRAAKDIWDSINSMGAWAFNKSHSVAYALVSYWTCWLKAHHPLAYAAAALRNAKDDDSAFALLRELDSEGITYVPFDPQHSQLNWAVIDGQLVGGFLGVKGVGPAKAKALLEQRESGKPWTPAQQKTLDNAQLVYGDLYPAHRQFGAYYNDPDSVGVRGPVLNIAEFPDDGEVVFIAMIREKDPRDKNEAIVLAKRGGKLMKGPTAFLDMRMTDDSTSSNYLVRVDRYDYEPTGRLLMERARENVDWFLIRARKVPGINMCSVIKIKCLTDPDMLKEKR